MVDQVTFPPSIGGSGKTYTNDANPQTGMFNGGHRVNFFPILADTVAAAGYVSRYAQAIDGAKANADRAEDARGYVEAVAGGVENNIVAKYKHSAVIDLDFERGEYSFDDGEREQSADFSSIGSVSRSTPVSLTGPTGNLRSVDIHKLPRVWPLNGPVGAAFLPPRTNFVAQSYTPWMGPWTSGGAGYFNNQRQDEFVPGVGVVSVAHYGPAAGTSSFDTSVSRQAVSLSAGIYTVSCIFKSMGEVSSPTVRSLHRATGTGSGSSGSLVANLFGDGGERGVSRDVGNGSFGSIELLYCRPIGNGFYEYAERLELLEPATVELRHFPYSGGFSFTGDGEAGLLRTAVQVELGQWPTPAIETASSAVSRTISQVQLQRNVGDMAFNQFTLFIDVTLSHFSQQDHTDNVQGIITLSSGSDVRFISLITRSDSPRLRWMLRRISETENLDVFVSSAATFGRRHRVAISVKDGLQVGCANGGSAVTANSELEPGVFKEWDRLVLMGYYEAFNRRSFGTLHNVMLLPTALTGAELQELTQL